MQPWTRRFLLPVLMLPFLLMGLPAQRLAAAEGSDPYRAAPRIALVLSGGGARGIAHVGVIRRLEELQIPIDLVVGTSMGAIIGGMYAAGYSADDMEGIIRDADWYQTFTDNPPRDELWFRRRQDDQRFQVDLELGWQDGSLALPPGFINGLNTESFLEQVLLPVLPVHDFDALPIPFRCLATDAKSGAAVVFQEGNLATALRASMSIPGVFAPVEHQGRMLIDGGVVDNFPVRTALAMGAESIIAVDLPDQDGTDIGKQSAAGIFNQMLRIMSQSTRRDSLAALRAQDVLISPQVGALGIMDFDQYAEAIEVGHAAAIGVDPQLAKFIVSPAEYSRWRETRRQKRPAAPWIRQVRIASRSGLSDAVIARRVAITPHARLSGAELRTTRGQVAGLGIFQHVGIELVPVTDEPGHPDANDVVVAPIEKGWGRSYFRFGLGISSDLQGEGEFDVGIQHTLTPINSHGGEWRNEMQIGTRGRVRSEFYQPIDSGLRWFGSPYVQYDYDSVPIIIDRLPVAEYDLDSFTVGLTAGRNLGYWGELRTDYGRATGTARPRIVPPGFERQTVHLREQVIVSTLTIDTLDSTNLPSEGFFSDLAWTIRNQDFTYGTNKSVLAGRGSVPVTFGALTLLTSVEAGSSLVGDPSFGNEFYLGGFRRLSGLSPREISGDQLLLGVLQAYYRLGNRTTRFGMAPFVGATFEAGNVWQDRNQVAANDLVYSGSLYLGAETFLGQGYLGGGYAKGDQLAIYLFVGPTF